MIGYFQCFSGFLVQKYIEKHPNYSCRSLTLETFFSLFNRNAKIHRSGTAKSRRDEAKRMPDSDSAAKKTQKMIILTIPKFLFSNAVLLIKTLKSLNFVFQRNPPQCVQFMTIVFGKYLSKVLSIIPWVILTSVA